MRISSEMKAEYVNHMGDDLTVVNAARVSFDKESDWQLDIVPDPDPDAPYLGGVRHTVVESSLSDRDTKLINYLSSHGHFTPFTHPQITLRETVPIFVARQRFKHVVGFTQNEVSRRYVDDEPEFYLPEVWRGRPTGGAKQGSGEALGDEEQANLSFKYERTVSSLYGRYFEMIAAGVAPEQARMILPQSMFTSYYVTGSLAAFARAYKQRIDKHAQLEIQELAKEWDAVIRPLFPVSWEALTNG